MPGQWCGSVKRKAFTSARVSRSCWYLAAAARSSAGCARMQSKIKRFTNDELRQCFIDICAGQVKLLGMTLPDDRLAWNEHRGHYDFGPIDWEEFRNVINGNGPCNKQRLEARVKAHVEGAWVREAAVAHARKNSNLNKEEAA